MIETTPEILKVFQSATSVIDVGSRNGSFSRQPDFREYFDLCLFEPDPDGFNTHLATDGFRKVTGFNSALGNFEGEAKLNISVVPEASSLFVPSRGFVDRYHGENFITLRQVKVPVTRFDSIHHKLESPYGLIKLDTQGSELDILRGAQQWLCSYCSAVIVEVEHLGVYANQPLFEDVHSFLKSVGFTLFALDSSHRSTRRFSEFHGVQGARERLCWSDAYYFKDPLTEAMHKPACNSTWEEQTEMIHCVIKAACFLRFFDFALEVTEHYLGVEATNELLTLISVQSGLVRR